MEYSSAIVCCWQLEYSFLTFDRDIIIYLKTYIKYVKFFIDLIALMFSEFFVQMLRIML